MTLYVQQDNDDVGAQKSKIDKEPKNMKTYSLENIRFEWVKPVDYKAMEC